jgi:hypothetical protein
MPWFQAYHQEQTNQAQSRTSFSSSRGSLAGAPASCNCSWAVAPSLHHNVSAQALFSNKRAGASWPWWVRPRARLLPASSQAPSQAPPASSQAPPRHFPVPQPPPRHHPPPSQGPCPPRRKVVSARVRRNWLRSSEIRHPPPQLRWSRCRQVASARPRRNPLQISRLRPRVRPWPQVSRLRPRLRPWSQPPPPQAGSCPGAVIGCEGTGCAVSRADSEQAPTSASWGRGQESPAEWARG